MIDWFNYEASLKILLFSVLAGGLLPGLFALGFRFQAVGAGHAGSDGVPIHRRTRCCLRLPMRSTRWCSW